jgi:hypothetical protein
MGLEGLPLDVKKAAIEEFGEENFQMLSDTLDFMKLQALFSRLDPDGEILRKSYQMALEECTVEERLKGLNPDVVFSQFTPEQIEAYLQKIKPTLH